MFARLKRIGRWFNPQWHGVALEARHRVRFPECCLVCGEHRPNRAWPLVLERARGTVFEVPCCPGCAARMTLRRTAAWVVLPLPIALLAIFDVPLRPEGPAPNQFSDHSLQQVAMVLAIMIGLLTWLGMLRWSHSERAFAVDLGDRWLFSFRNADYARRFAAENEPLANGTAAWLLPGAADHGATTTDDKSRA